MLSVKVIVSDELSGKTYSLTLLDSLVVSTTELNPFILVRMSRNSFFFLIIILAVTWISRKGAAVILLKWERTYKKLKIIFKGCFKYFVERFCRLFERWSLEGEEGWGIKEKKKQQGVKRSASSAMSNAHLTNNLWKGLSCMVSI